MSYHRETYGNIGMENGLNSNVVLKELRSMLNKAYGDSVFKLIKILVEGTRVNYRDLLRNRD